jgi:hypothetical protein
MTWWELEPDVFRRIWIIVSHARGGDTVGNPVHWPLGNVVVKEGEHGDQLMLRGEEDEGEENVGLVDKDGIFGVTTLDEGWDALVVVEAGRKHVPQVFQRAAAHGRDEVHLRPIQINLKGYKGDSGAF